MRGELAGVGGGRLEVQPRLTRNGRYLTVVTIPSLDALASLHDKMSSGYVMMLAGAWLHYSAELQL